MRKVIFKNAVARLLLHVKKLKKRERRNQRISLRARCLIVSSALKVVVKFKVSMYVLYLSPSSLRSSTDDDRDVSVASAPLTKDTTLLFQLPVVNLITSSSIPSNKHNNALNTSALRTSVVPPLWSWRKSLWIKG